MNALVQTKLDKRTYRDMAHLGTRFLAGQACERGVVDYVAPAEDALRTAVEVAAKLAPKGKNRQVMNALKEEGYAAALHALRSGGLGWGAKVGALARL